MPTRPAILPSAMGMIRLKSAISAGAALVFASLVLTGCAEVAAVLPGNASDRGSEPGPADLAVVWLRTVPAEVSLGSAYVEFDLIIANLGQREAGESTSRFTLVDPAGRDVMEHEEFSTGKLGPGETHVVRRYPVHLPVGLTDGVYELTVDLDIQSELVQSDYANDSAVALLEIVHPCPDKSEPVRFADLNMQAAVSRALELAAAAVTCEELLGLTELDAAYSGITSLAGLERALRLQRLSVQGNGLDSLLPIAGLEALRSLDITDNLISDLSPLADLPALTHLFAGENPFDSWPAAGGFESLFQLNLSGSPVRDLSSLAGHERLRHVSLSEAEPTVIDTIATWQRLYSLTLRNSGLLTLEPLEGVLVLPELRELSLPGNGISDLSPLAAVTGLEFLHLGENRVSDLTALQQLSNLRYLWLERNFIRDISPLLLLPELSEGSNVLLYDNCLDLTEGSTAFGDVQTLLSRGVQVTADPQRDDCGVAE